MLMRMMRKLHQLSSSDHLIVQRYDLLDLPPFLCSSALFSRSLRDEVDDIRLNFKVILL